MTAHIVNNRKADIFLLILLAFSIIASSYQSLNMIGLYVCMPIFILSIWFRNWSGILKNKYVRFYLALVLWMILTALIGVDLDRSMHQMPMLLASFLISASIYQLALKPQNTNWLYLIYILYYLSLLLYLYFGGGLYISDSTETERAGDVSMNANNFAYYLLYLTFGVHYLLSQRSKNLFFEGIIYLVLTWLTLYIALITASRQVLIIQIPFIALLFLIRFLDKGKRNPIPFFLIVIVLVLVLLPWFENIYSDSLLSHRSEIALGDDNRTILLKRAIEVGNENVLAGVGYGNFVKYTNGAFSHNSFAELYACTGLLGFFLYAIMVVSFVIEQIKRYRRTHDRLFVSFAVVGLFYIVSNFFYVYYDTIWLIGFFFILVGHSQQCYQRTLNNQL